MKVVAVDSHAQLLSFSKLLSACLKSNTMITALHSREKTAACSFDARILSPPFLSSMPQHVNYRSTTDVVDVSEDTFIMTDSESIAADHHIPSLVRRAVLEPNFEARFKDAVKRDYKCDFDSISLEILQLF